MAWLERQTGLGTAAGGAIGAAGVVGGVGCHSTGSEAAGRTTSTDGKVATLGPGSLGDSTGGSLGDNTGGLLGMDTNRSINGATGSGTGGEATSIARATDSR